MTTSRGSACAVVRAFLQAGLTWGVLVSATSAVVADDGPVARPPLQRITADDVSGEWALTLPLGYKRTVTLRPEGETAVRLLGAGTSNGLYQIHLNRLVMKEPIDERLTEFKWLVYKDLGIIVLYEEPPAGKTGAQYTGAILTNRKRVDFPIVEKPAEGPSQLSPEATASVTAPAPVQSATQTWGTLRGNVVIEGELPPVEFLRKGDPIYQLQGLQDQIAGVPRVQTGTQDEDVVDTAVQVDKQTHGLANVFVYLKKRPATVQPRADKIAELPLEFVRTKWSFEPRALFAQTNQPIRVSTSVPDRPFSLHTMPSQNSPINQVFGGQNSPDVVKFDKREPLPMSVADDFGPTARASWLILDHPYAAVTAADGSFEIRDLPAGEHELIVWHERPGFIAKKYKVIARPNEVTHLAPIRVEAAKLKRTAAG